MLVTVTFSFREREIPLDGDSPYRYDLPEAWREWRAECAVESRAGIQEIPGSAYVTSVDQRHLVFVAPREPIQTDDISTWPTFRIGGIPYQVSGVLLLNNIEGATSESYVTLNGLVNPPARVYYVEGEEMAKVGLWEGIRRIFAWWWT